MTVDAASDQRICYVGDSFVLGTGDETGLGWTGRVAAAARRAGHDVTAYNLGVRRDTSDRIRIRWFPECTARIRPDCAFGTVFSFGANDMTLEAGALRVTVEDSLANFIAIIAGAKTLGRVLALGPLPVGDPAQDQRIAMLCALYANAAAEAGVPYLPLLKPLSADDRWQRAVARGDGTHPDGSGYELIAGHLLRWPAWWFFSTAGNT